MKIKKFWNFLANFIKPKVLSQNRNINKLVTVDYTNENNQLGKILIFVGAKSKSIIGKAKNNDVIVTEFLQNLIKVSAKCS